jgi:hypothetical protein
VANNNKGGSQSNKKYADRTLKEKRKAMTGKKAGR